MSAAVRPLQPRRKRWYDSRPMIANAVQMLDSLPNDIVSQITGGVDRIAQRDYEADRMIHTLKSLGKDKVMALYKAKAKKRHCDEIPNYHKLMNYWTILPEQQQNSMATHVYDLSGCIYDYLHLCKNYRQTATVQDIETITDVYVGAELGAVKRFLAAVENNFKVAAAKQAAQQKAAESTMTTPQNEMVTDRDDGDMSLGPEVLKKNAEEDFRIAHKTVNQKLP